MIPWDKREFYAAFRGRIREYVISNPGKRGSEISDAFGVRNSELHYHFHFLQRNGDIRKDGVTNQTRWYPGFRHYEWFGDLVAAVRKSIAGKTEIRLQEISIARDLLDRTIVDLEVSYFDQEYLVDPAVKFILTDLGWSPALVESCRGIPFGPGTKRTVWFKPIIKEKVNA